jgi:hypothetical protein
MIPVIELLYGIDQRLNKLGTGEHQMIPDEDKLLALNEAQLTLLKQKVDGNNVYKLGLDGFKKRYHDLQGLIEPFEAHPLTLTLTDSRLHKYSTALPDNLLFYIDSYLTASKDGCTDRVIYCNAALAKHQDITLLLRNSNYAPSFDYQETLVSLSNGVLEVYTDGQWENDTLYLSYLRYPKQMSMEGLEDMMVSRLTTRTVNWNTTSKMSSWTLPCCH